MARYTLVAAVSLLFGLILLSVTGNAGTVPVTFTIVKQVEYGQGFVIAGNVTELGNWKVSAAPLMNVNGTGNWTWTREFTAGEAIEFKPFLVMYDNQSEIIKELHGSNLTLTVPENYDSVLAAIYWPADSPTTSSLQQMTEGPSRNAGTTRSTVAVTFQIVKRVQWKQGLEIAGNVAELGNWNVTAAPLMNITGDNNWTWTGELTAGETIEFKPVLVNYDRKCVIEWLPGGEETNMILMVPQNNHSMLVEIYWPLLSNKSLNCSEASSSDNTSDNTGAGEPDNTGAGTLSTSSPQASGSQTRSKKSHVQALVAGLATLGAIIILIG